MYNQYGYAKNVQLIDGHKLAKNVIAEAQTHLQEKQTKIAIILASDDEPSQTYVNLKSKKAQELGIDVEIKKFKQSVTVAELNKTIAELNQDPEITGILLQLPLYEHLEPKRLELLNLISPEKDIDGLGAYNQGLVTQGYKEAMLPATVLALLKILDSIKHTETLAEFLQDKHVVIINRSVLVGRPLAQALLSHYATVSIAHAYTPDLPSLVKQADILVSATGEVGLITADMLKQDAIVLDVTSKKTATGVKGDVQVDAELRNKLSYLTPVPGGVGPMTIACLLHNLAKTATKTANHDSV